MVLGLGVGGGAKGDGAPRDGLESLDASAGVTRDSVPSSTLEFPPQFSRFLPLCLPPPPTPKPSTTSRTGWGGGANLHIGRWTGHQEKGIWSATSRRVEHESSDGQTTDAQPLLEVVG